MFGDATFDFVYSYAVFQHIPSRDVVFHYLARSLARAQARRHSALPDQRTPATREAVRHLERRADRARRDSGVHAHARFSVARARKDLDAIHVDHVPQAASRLGDVTGAMQPEMAVPRHHQRAHRRSGRARFRTAGSALALDRAAARGLRLESYDGDGRWPRVPSHLYRSTRRTTA